MLFHFSIYRNGSIEAVQARLTNIISARVKAWRLLNEAMRSAVLQIPRELQARIVVSDSAGLELFTLAYLASNGESREKRCTDHGISPGAELFGTGRNA